MLEWTMQRIYRDTRNTESFLEAEKDVHINKKKDEGIIKNFSNWADNSGYLLFLLEFENIDDFTKLWADEEY